MLAVDVNEFGWSVSNYDSTDWTLAAFGSAVTPGTNTKGTTASLLSNIAYDAWGVYVCVGGAGASTFEYGGLLDVVYDAANGTSWTSIIPNLGYSGSTILKGGNWWYFPVFIPAGSAIGVRAAAWSGTTAIRVGVKVVGQPSYPELVRVGSYVETFNAATSTSYGTTAHVPGASGVWGSFTASLGTTANKLWFWQASCQIKDAALVKNLYHKVDVWGGASSSDKLLIKDASWIAIDDESLSNINPQQSNYKDLPAGSGIYVRGSAGGAAETTHYCQVHGVGG